MATCVLHLMIYRYTLKEKYVKRENVFLLLLLVLYMLLEKSNKYLCVFIKFYLEI